MNEHDNKLRAQAAERSTDDALDFWGAATPPSAAPAALGTPENPVQLPSVRQVDPAATPQQQPTAAKPSGPTTQRTAPFPEQPSGYEFWTVPPGGGTGAGAPTAATGTGGPSTVPGMVPQGPPATGVAAGSPSLIQKPQEPASKSFGDVMTSIAKDIGWGMVEAIPQFTIGGRVDYAKHAFGFIQDFGDAMEKIAPWMFDPEMSEVQRGNKEAMDALRKKYSGFDSFAQWVGDAVGEPTTVTGGLFRKAGEFTTGFGPALATLKAIGTTGIMAPTAAGALAGFIGQAPDEQGLANMLKDKLPTGIGDALAPLAINPDDPKLVNRARHALEQAGFGVAAEGIIKGVKALRAWNMARKAQQAGEQAPEAAAIAGADIAGAKTLVEGAAPKLPTQGKLFELVEQPATEAVAANKLQEVKVATDPGVPAHVMAEAVARGQTLPGIKLNYEAILAGKLDDVAIQLGNAILERISAAKRGKVTNDMTRLLADKLGMTPDDLLAKPVGEAWNATKIWGAAALLGQAEQDLKVLANIARAPGSSVADGFAFRRQLTYYNAMLENFMGVAGEAGRALQIFRAIHSSGVLRQARAIQAVIERAGGLDNTRALASVIADADNMALATVARKGWGATTAEAIRTTEIMNMLWRPATQIRNIVGNIGMIAMAGMDVVNASRVGWFTGTEAAERITRAGAAANWEGQLYAIRSAFSAAGKAFRTNESQFFPEMGGGRTAMEGGAQSISAPERLGAEMKMTNEQIAQFKESGLGQALHYLSVGTTLPGRFLTAADDFFKTMIYAGKVRQNAVDEAMRQGLTGREFENYVAKNTLNPPEHIHADAYDWSMWATFNDPAGAISGAAMKARDAMGPLGYLTMPFVRTPGKIMNVTFEHTPLAAVMPSFWRDVMKGGVDRDIALGKMATGAAILTTMIAYAESGHLTDVVDIHPDVEKLLGKHITGSLPHNQALADAYQGLGVQKYALRFGDKWVAVSGLGPYAPLMSYAAELNDIFRKKDVRPDEYTRLQQHIGLAIGAIYNSMKDQSYLQGFADLTHALDESAKGKEGAWESWANRWLGSAIVGSVPIIGGLIQSTQRIWEPQPAQRNIYDVWGAIKSRTVGLSETLSPARDRLGDILPHPTWSGDQPWWGRLYDWFMPFQISQFKSSPLREEMVRMHSGLERLDKVTSFDGVTVDFRNHPEPFDWFVRLAGNEAKDPVFKLGFHDYMNAVIKGDDPRFRAQHKEYMSLSDSFGETAPGTKMAYIKGEAERFKQMAVEKVKADAALYWPDFYQQVIEAKQRKQAFETGRVGIVPPLENWSIGAQRLQSPTNPTDYTRPPREPAQEAADEPPPKSKQNGSGGAGFTVPSR